MPRSPRRNVWRGSGNRRSGKGLEVARTARAVHLRTSGNGIALHDRRRIILPTPVTGSLGVPPNRRIFTFLKRKGCPAGGGNDPAMDWIIYNLKTTNQKKKMKPPTTKIRVHVGSRPVKLEILAKVFPLIAARIAAYSTIPTYIIPAPPYRTRFGFPLILII
jgi:hypothetical protein